MTDFVADLFKGEKGKQELNENQKKAVQEMKNVVVSAGAGSGKTKVLATRFAYIILSQDCDVSQILTLTFTNKAVREMRSRIYSTLLGLAKKGSAKAKAAINDFGRAQIMTLDSYCASIAKRVCNKFGISPDFATDEVEIKRQIQKRAFSFVVENRSRIGFSALLSKTSAEKIAQQLLVPIFSDEVSAADSPDFLAGFERQKSTAAKDWRETKAELQKIAQDALDCIEECYAKIEDREPVQNDLQALIDADDADSDIFLPENRQNLIDFYKKCQKINKINLNKGKKDCLFKEIVKSFRKKFENFASLLNFIVQNDIASDLAHLLQEFSEEAGEIKRRISLLSFADAAKIALFALATDPDLRAEEKAKFKKIMIDEFQDNNSLQRNLLFLLAEKPECAATYDADDEAFFEKIPLRDDALFFVGDSKQSIYKFRGADVSVFNSLKNSPKFAQINLSVNYRSNEGLISFFNRFFGGFKTAESGQDFDKVLQKNPSLNSIFLKETESPPKYEATYEPLLPKEKKDFSPKAHFCFFDGEVSQENADDGDEIENCECESNFVAQKIAELHKNGVPFEEIAILERSTTHQAELEKSLTAQKIPFSVEKLSSFSSEALANDFYFALRLAVHPDEKATFTRFLTSPFVGMSAQAAKSCLLCERPFGEVKNLEAADAKKLAFAKALFDEISEKSRVLSIREMASFLYFEKGWNFAALDRQDIFSVHFDYFFELANQADKKGESLAEFLEDLKKILEDKEKIDELNVLSEKQNGVRIMTIHKSKGLEFPYVFLPFTNERTKSLVCEAFFVAQNSADGIKKGDISLKIPAFEVSEKDSNYFFEREKAEVKRQEEAELRRLFYVAATRAEKEIFITATCKLIEQAGQNSFLLEIKGEGEKEKTKFFQLFAPIFNFDSSAEGKKSFDFFPFSAENAADSDLKPSAEEKKQFLREQEQQFLANNMSFLAEKTHFIASNDDLPQDYAKNAKFFKIFDGRPADFSELNAALRKIKAYYSAEDFGTFAHAAIERALSSGAGANYQKALEKLAADTGENEKNENFAAICAACHKMRDDFCASEFFAQRVRGATKKLCECKFRLFDGGKIVSGQIDLAADMGDFVQIVDFKTDLEERPENHASQMLAYFRAAESLWNKKAKVCLYYLRSGAVYELEAQT